jgi:hypothetical protein
MHENDEGIHRLLPLKHTTGSPGEQRTALAKKIRAITPFRSHPVTKANREQVTFCVREVATAPCSVPASVDVCNLFPAPAFPPKFWLRCPRSLAPSTVRKSRSHPPDGVNKALTHGRHAEVTLNRSFSGPNGDREVDWARRYWEHPSLDPDLGCFLEKQ